MGSYAVKGKHKHGGRKKTITVGGEHGMRQSSIIIGHIDYILLTISYSYGTIMVLALLYMYT